MPTTSQICAAIHHDLGKRIPALIEAARTEERDRILGLCEFIGEQHDADGPEADVLGVLTGDIISGADDRDPPSARMVVGGPAPKPGEVSEAAMDRLDLRELRAEVLGLEQIVRNLIESGSTQQDAIEELREIVTPKQDAAPPDDEILPGMHAHMAKTEKDRLWIVVNGLIESFEGHTATIEHLQMDLLALLRPPVIDVTEIRALGAHIAEIRDWIAEHDAPASRPTITMPIMEGDGAAPAREAMREAQTIIADMQAVRMALVTELDATQIALITARDRLQIEQDACTELRMAHLVIEGLKIAASDEEFTVAVRQARTEAIEDCARAAEAAEDPVDVFSKHDGRIGVLEGTDCPMQRRLCAAAIRALDPTRKDTPMPDLDLAAITARVDAAFTAWENTGTAEAANV